MAKSAWKFSKTTIKDIYFFMREYGLLTEKKGRQYYGLCSKKIILNNINYMHKYVFHQGSTLIIKRFYEYSLRSTPNAFVKFTKPFWFRSKKKRK